MGVNGLSPPGKQKNSVLNSQKEGIAKFQAKMPVRAHGAKRLEAFLTRELKVHLGKRYPTARDLMLFCRQLAALSAAGVTYFHSLQLLGEQMGHRVLRETLRDVASRVERGYSLAESFKANNDVFPALLINLMEAGEVGGFLDAALERLALYFEKQYELEQKIRSATLYPKFIAAAAAAAVVFLLVVVLPAFAGIFENMGLTMPPLTRLLISAGNVLLSYWYILLMVMLAAFLLGKGLIKTERGRRIYDSLLLNNPLCGSIYRKMIAARFCRTLGTLLGSGTAMLPSLDLVKKVSENSIYAENISRTREGIIQGQSLAGALSDVHFFPPLVIEMCRVGEQTGNLGEMLGSAANFFESEVSHTIERSGSLIEPVLILFMAGIIVLIALSVLLPMFEVYQMF